DKTKGSDAEITNLEEPVANSILSFEFFNFYDKSHNEISDILKNMDIDYNESAGFKELNKFNANVSKKRFNREGELFTYKINTKAIEEYFRSKLETNFKGTFFDDKYVENQSQAKTSSAGRQASLAVKIKNYTKILIEYLNRLQIFEEFNAKRVEYNYNCLIYALYTWMKDNLSEDLAQKICLDLLCFNFSRFVTLKDVSVINKYFKNNAKYLGKRYKIKIYKWNNVLNRLRVNSKDEVGVDYYIPIALLESSNIDININHFIIYENIDFMKIAKKIGLSETEFTKENNDEMLKLINNLKGDSKNNNWKTLNGYLLIKYLLNSEVEDKDKNKLKFFTPLNNDEIDELIDEKDELNNKIKEKELYKMINEMSNYDLSILQERAFKRVKTIINSKFNKKDYKDINDFISGVIINDKKYTHLCFYDFEASTHEKDHHKAYMVCYAIINFPERILSEADLIKFKEDFNKNYKIQTIYGEDCAERFLKAIPDKTLCYAHNAKYDTSFFDYSNIDIVESCEKDGNMYSRDIIYNNKYITFKDSYKLISSKLSKFPEMFALGDIQKEVFPYNFYTIDNLNKYKDDYDINGPEYQKFENELRQGFNKINDAKKNEAYEKFKEIIKTKFNGIFNMRRYSQFYCERDVEILFKGLICMRTYLYKITALDCLKYLTISTIAHRHMINDVYSKTSFSSDSKTNDDNKNKESSENVNNNTYLEDLYNTTGVLNQYIQSSIWGGVCASYKNAKLLIKKVISDFDAVSLYTSAMKRINIITGKCRKFELNELDEINKSMNVYDENNNVVGYNNKNCWLLKNTNKENEKDKDKINMYIVTIRIKDSKIKRDNPRIVVKNELLHGCIKKYPNLPVGNIMVNVDKNADLNDYRYKYDHVNECIVTIDNIMLEDYIEFHDIEFEVLAGVYWRDCCTIPLIECFLKYSVLESKSQELIDKYDDILDAKFLIKPELKEAYYDLVEKYQNIRNGVKGIVQGKKLEKLTNEEKNKIVEANKKIEKIKEEINDLDDILCNTRSSKHSKIQDVMQQLFNARLKYKSEGNPLEGVIKLLLNSVYGKTIQKPTTKKINYVRVLVNNEIDLNEKPEHVRKYIINEYNRFVENYRLKLDDMYSNDEITKDEYDSKINSIEKLVTINDDGIFKCYYSPLITFVENNKNKIVGMNKVNNNMYRIETIEQIEQHKSFNHVGVQILSMSKRIVNEVICTAQDLGFKVYYQDTDSIHIDYANIPKLSEEFKRKYNRDLIGKGLGQFHSDFAPCKVKNGSKPDVTLALLTIINGKKNYIDVKFNPACYFENFDKDKDYNVCLDKKYREELDVENIINNYHIRNKGINKSGVVSTSEELNVSCPELYLKIFNNERIKFNLSKARPSFQFTKKLTVVSKELNRFVQTEGNRIVIEEGKKDIIIAENEKNRKNVKVEVDMSVRDHPVINIVGKIENDY
ncbi:MAG: DNA polymerase, partial [Candidatus Onthovivens sp.]|nr:DNA polymerase [Candidatus Onthovivens sp.]